MDEDVILPENFTPPDLRSEANEAKKSIIPEVSKSRYEQCYNNFLLWKSSKNVNIITENVILAYFKFLAESKAPPTLWAIYSMLRSMLNFKHGLNIMEYHNLIAFIKNKNKGYVPTKAGVFSENQISTFIKNAPNDTYLATKVATIFGVMGACRSDELVNVRTQDIEIHGNMFLVKIPKTKTSISRSFTISDQQYFDIVMMYKNFRPINAKTDRFFLNYQHGKCTTQVIGKHKFAKMPFQIATFLNLSNPQTYTGHSFRRTSTTFLANAGADLLTIKRHGGWRSSTVAEGYIENSLSTKKKTENLISSSITNMNQINEETASEIATSVQKKPFQFKPKKPYFSNQSNNVNNNNTNLDNFILETFEDESTYISQTEMQTQILSNSTLPNNYIFNNCNVTFCLPK